MGPLKPLTVTESGIEIQPVYGPPDGQTDPRIGEPGRPPFTRGIHPEMYRQRLWTIRQYSGFGDPSDSNARFRSLMAQGQTGLSIAFDLPTQLGYDADEPIARPEVGRVGVSVNTLDDLAALFDGIPLEQANASFTINAPAPVFVAMFAALAKRQGVDPASLRGTFQNDIVKEFLTRGTYVFPPAPSIKLTGDVIEYCNKLMPSVYPINICGSHIRDTGCHGLDALAIVLANALLYLEECRDRGLAVAEVAARFSFLFCARQDPLVEAAAIRATRRLWAALLQERFGITDEAALKFRLFNGTSNQMFTRQEPYNNIVRGTLACMGIVLGGAQAGTVIGFDEAYDIPSEEAQRIALRTQQIVAYETTIPATVDPLAGSYYVEAMTDESERRLRVFLEEIDERGGMVAAVESGWIQERMYDRAYELERGVESGEVPVVGVNLFASADSNGELFGVGELHEPDEGVAERQIERLVQHRASRDGAAAEAALEPVRDAAVSGANVCDPLETALVAGATLGECMGVLRSVYGTYREGGNF